MNKDLLEIANLLEKINDGSIYEETNSVSSLINNILEKFEKIIK
jgi:hypothetical protein